MKLNKRVMKAILLADQAIKNKELCFNNKKKKFEWLDIEHKHDTEPTILDELRERCGDGYDPFCPGIGSQILSKYLEED